MNENRFTENSLLLIFEAKNIAVDYNNQRLNSLHLLKSVMTNQNKFLEKIFEKKNINKKKFLDYLNLNLEKIPKVTGKIELHLDEDFKDLINYAEKLSNSFGDSFISTDCLIIALTFENLFSNKIFKNFDIKFNDFNSEILNKKNGSKVDSKFEDENTNFMKKFTKDLTDLAKKGKIDPIIGRDDEIRRTMQVLSRRTKNNPVLIGEPGVGKTAIAEGLALRIVSQDVPQYLIGKKLLSLDIGLIVAGAKYRGEFEERIKGILKEVNNAKGEIIIFIDEMHTLIGAGKGDGSLDASNLIKPALARGELHCLSATTLNEYQKYVEKDPALARRFQTIFVNAPSVEDTISILRGIKGKYELHHGVKILDSSLITAARLSDRYIADRFLPDKAIDLIDEASSRVRMELDSKPEDIDKLDREILQKKIELQAIISSSEVDTEIRLKEIEEKLNSLKEKSRILSDSWKKERSQVLKTRYLKNKLEETKVKYEQAKRKGDLVLAGELAYSKIPSIEKEISEFENEEFQKLTETVSSEHVASVVEKWTGIPVEKIINEEKSRFLNMENIFSKKIIGQKKAIRSICNAVKRAKAGLNDINRPLASFLFLGTTGVGKTELSKCLANFLFQENASMTRIDMSEYMEKHNVSKLIGAPPGYVGYEERGVLTEAVRRRPYQVILFDEVEKAHPDVLNILLQIMDDGRITDSQGILVDFKNTIIILTSNLGSSFYFDENLSKENLEKNIMKEVNSFFKPEFLNRLDEILFFDLLSKQNIKEIINLKLHDLEQSLDEKNISICISNPAKNLLSDLSFDPNFGARPVKRIIQTFVQDKIAEIILNRIDDKNLIIKIDRKDRDLSFSF